MNWLKTANPRARKTFSLMAFATLNAGLEGGYVARIYNAGDFPERPIPGATRWGATPEAALRRAISDFDPGATLPERREICQERAG